MEETADTLLWEKAFADKKIGVMSEENYRNLSAQLTDLRKDMDARFEKMDWRRMIASVLVPLSAVALAFVGACAVVIFQ